MSKISDNLTKISERNKPIIISADDKRNIDNEISRIKSFLEKHNIRPIGVDGELLFSVMVNYIAKRRLKIKCKGLLLCGDVGVGKTYILELINAILDTYMCTAEELVLRYKKDSESFYDMDQRMLRHQWSNSVLLDDLGMEIMINDYGEKQELMSSFITKRYEMYQDNGAVTVITSNLDDISIKERYGIRIWSRLNSMCDIYGINGKDLRIN